MYIKFNQLERAGFYILCALALIWAEGCTEPSLATSADLRPLWRRATRTDNRPVESAYPITWEDRFMVILSRPGDSSRILSLRQADGSTAWEKTLDNAEEKVYYNLQSSLQGNVLVLPLGKITQAIDCRNGQKLWHFRHQGSPEPVVSRAEEGVFFRAVNDWERKLSFLARMDSHTGQAQDLYPQLWPDSAMILLRTPAYLGDGEIIFTSIIYDPKRRYTYAEWYVAHADGSGIKARGKAYPDNLGGYGVTKQPAVTSKYIILTAYDQLFCLERGTYKEKWRINLPRDMLSSMPLIHENQIYCALEDGYLYSIGMDNGDIIWKSSVAGTPGRIAVYEEHLFLVGGADGVLYTINKTDGSRIRAMKGPNHSYKEEEFFRRFIGLANDTGRLLLYDGSHFRCYSVWAD